MANLRKAGQAAPSMTRTGRASIAKNGQGMLDVTVLLLEAGYASTAIGPIEVFHSAGLLWNRLRGEAAQPRFRVRIASVDGRPVTSLCSLGLVPEFSIGDIDRTDIVILPASGLDNMLRIARETPLIPWLRAMHARGAHVASICSGAGLLAEAGLLDDREATTHWAVADGLRDRYPNVRWRPEQFVTEDRRVYCSGGVYASIDLSLYLVEKFCGHEVALQCAKALLVSMPRSHQSGYSVTPLSRPHPDGRIRKAEEYLRRHFDRIVPIPELADRVGMSPRNFIRRFKAATGRLPGDYLQRLRISAAREMLESGRESVQDIASKVGYEDVAFFRNVFRRHTGMTPAEYRHAFAPMSLERGEIATGTA